MRSSTVERTIMRSPAAYPEVKKPHGPGNGWKSGLCRASICCLFTVGMGVALIASCNEVKVLDVMTSSALCGKASAPSSFRILARRRDGKLRIEEMLSERVRLYEDGAMFVIMVVSDQHFPEYHSADHGVINILSDTIT